MAENRPTGPIMMFSSAVLFSIMAVFVKLLSKSVPAAEIIFFRSFISVVLLLLLVGIGKVRFTARSKEKLIFRGIVGGISLMLYFYSISLTSLANAVLLAYTYPIFASIFSMMYLKEELTREKIMFMLAAFFGLLLILDFDFSALNTGDLIALLSAVTSGMAVVSIRELRKTDSSAVIVFSFVLSGTIFSLFFMKGNIAPLNSTALLMLLLIGVIGAFGQLFMTAAYKLCSTALGGVISMSSVIMTAIFSMVVFGERLTPNIIVGGLLIFISAVFFSQKEQCEIGK